MNANDYAQDLKLQMAIKADQKYQEKLQDRVKDYNHLDTVEHYSPYGK
jgi:uncharacterized protein YlxW (UPF0749 family)